MQNDNISNSITVSSHNATLTGYVQIPAQNCFVGYQWIQCPACGAWYTLGSMHSCYAQYNHWQAAPVEDKYAKAFRVAKKMMEDGDVKDLKKFVELVEKIASAL